MASWIAWLLLCDSDTLVLRNFGRFRSSLNELGYLVWIVLCIHFDTVYPYRLVFMSQILGYWSSLPGWLRDLLPMASYYNGIDPKYKGGFVCMAAASAAIDRGVPIDAVLDTS